ncbi:hypothetical protein [Consotaella salsifontis]|uniref:hypothetical protein n=1 Tax=Consotaella salsifontis TaxID=1365950 RepID=UPI00105639C9|nr:hypothetical protein [Consotaella salsifontis]
MALGFTGSLQRRARVAPDFLSRESGLLVRYRSSALIRKCFSSDFEQLSDIVPEPMPPLEIDVIISLKEFSYQVSPMMGAIDRHLGAGRATRSITTMILIHSHRIGEAIDHGKY